MANLNPVSRKGRPNKTTKAVKDEIERAFIEKGGYKWLVQQMDENPTAFMSLLGRILPRVVDMKAEVEAKGVIIMANKHDIDL